MRKMKKRYSIPLVLLTFITSFVIFQELQWSLVCRPYSLSGEASFIYTALERVDGNFWYEIRDSKNKEEVFGALKKYDEYECNFIQDPEPNSEWKVLLKNGPDAPDSDWPLFIACHLNILKRRNLSELTEDQKSSNVSVFVVELKGPVRKFESVSDFLKHYDCLENYSYKFIGK